MIVKALVVVMDGKHPVMPIGSDHGHHAAVALGVIPVNVSG